MLESSGRPSGHENYAAEALLKDVSQDAVERYPRKVICIA